MKYYPVNLDVRDKKCLVIGGGEVGARKAETLAACGADVTVLSPAFSERCRSLESRRVRLSGKPYAKEDLAGVFLVFAATDDASLNRTIKEHAEERNILCNIADWPDGSGFTLPACVSRGDLLLTVSTAGKSPAVAKRIRRALEEQFGPEYETLLVLMGRIREKLLEKRRDPAAHKQQFNTLLDSGLLGLIGKGDKPAVDHLLKEVLGEGFEFDNLMAQEGV